MRLSMHEKLSPKYISSLEILDLIRSIAYRQALPPHLSGVHNVYHVFMLCKYELDPSHIANYEPIPLRDDLTYEEAPIRILDSKERVLKKKNHPPFKVQ